MKGLFAPVPIAQIFEIFAAYRRVAEDAEDSQRKAG